jgi:hypothetical protein
MSEMVPFDSHVLNIGGFGMAPWWFKIVYQCVMCLCGCLEIGSYGGKVSFLDSTCVCVG